MAAPPDPSPPDPSPPKRSRHAHRAAVLGQRTAYGAGVAAEALACQRIAAEGWTILGRRLRTAAGEIDIAAEKDGLLAMIEVKARPSLAGAAAALSARQRQRLGDACGVLLAQPPDWGRAGVRFDLIVVDAAGRVRRIADAFRVGDLPG